VAAAPGEQASRIEGGDHADKREKLAPVSNVVARMLGVEGEVAHVVACQCSPSIAPTIACSSESKVSRIIPPLKR
jgi:hypothetical protein